MNENKFVTRYLQPTIISLIVFAGLFFAANSYINFKEGQWESDIRSNILNLMTGKKSNLEKALYSRIYYTRGVAAYVALNPSISNTEFSELAREYIRKDSVISSMSLSKDCIINAIYPFEGHEAAIGLNLLDHPERRDIVEQTIKTHLTFVAGPVELVEGGIAFISYTPIFDKTTNEENKFWGVTDIVIKQNSLLEEANLKLTELGCNFALRGYNGKGKNGKVFWGDENIFKENPVFVNIELPMGTWELAALPVQGWIKYSDQDKVLAIILFLSVFIISVLIWLFSRALLKIRNNEKELKAIFNSMNSLIIEFNIKGDYLKINSETQDLLFLPKNELLGKNINNVFDKQTAQFFMDSIKECLENKKLVVIEYPLQINGKKHWFLARISYKSDTTAIFNAYDITDRKRQEELLIHSEKQLKELNEMKDKFFSIIAHDIKGPLGSQNAIINLIIDEFKDLDELTLKKMIGTLQESSNNLYVLLEDLLNWSLSQSGKIEVNREDFNLNKCVANVLIQFQKEAQLKNIRLENEIDDSVSVSADINLTKIIIRNLVSNALKFTNPAGRIRIFSEQVFTEGQKLVNIQVSDTGVGMDDKALDTLFRLDKTQSTRGTANEKGNGLGLLLCKEFTEKQGSKMKVKSTIGEGSVFSFKLPASK